VLIGDPSATLTVFPEKLSPAPLPKHQVYACVSDMIANSINKLATNFKFFIYFDD
jgi:hypothetical protein